MPVPQSDSWLRFPVPLIEPDGRFSRIRLSDWIHPGRSTFGPIVVVADGEAVWAVARRASRLGIVEFRDRRPCAVGTASVGAEYSRGDRLYGTGSRASRTSSSWPSPAVDG